MPTADAGGDETGSAPIPAADAGDGNTEPSARDGGQSEGTETASLDDAGDTGTTDPWAGCPEVALPENEAWPIRVRATEGAVYCAMFNESRTLVEEKAAKMQLRVAPGVHHVPDVDTEPLALPACIRDGVASVGVVGGGLTVVKSPGEGSTSFTLGFNQELEDRNSRRLQMSLQGTFADSGELEFLLDGQELESLEAYQSMDLCEVDGEYCFPNVIFTSCAYESGELNTHTIEFDGGHVTFDLRIGESFAGTEPGAFVASSGTYLDRNFSQDDYFKLIYHPAHHHFERAFVVLFDEPRGDVCGIEVSGLEPFGDDIPDAAFTVDCDLGHLESLQVTSHTLVRSSR